MDSSRLEAFEDMLAAVQKEYADILSKMEKILEVLKLDEYIKILYGEKPTFLALIILKKYLKVWSLRVRKRG